MTDEEAVEVCQKEIRRLRSVCRALEQENNELRADILLLKRDEVIKRLEGLGVVAD